MDLSIIIISFNTKDLLRNCLRSIFEKTKGISFEIIVVDNNSQDGSRAMLEKNFSARGGSASGWPKVKLIKNKENLGFAKANNIGAKFAQGKYLLFLNNDTYLMDNPLKAMVEFFSKNSKIAILGPRLLLGDKKTLQPYSFGKFSTLGGIIVSKFSPPHWDYDKISDVDWYTGAALMIRKDIFDRVGGFDENFFMYFEDVDLCLQVKKLGGKVHYYPKAEIVHLGGKGSSHKERKKFYYQSQNYFYKKNYNFLTYLLYNLLSFPYKFYILYLRTSGPPEEES